MDEVSQGYTGVKAPEIVGSNPSIRQFVNP